MKTFLPKLSLANRHWRRIVNYHKKHDSALVKNNELPFIRRGIHTYFRDSNKEGGRYFRSDCYQLLSAQVGYSELGNHMLMRLRLRVS